MSKTQKDPPYCAHLPCALIAYFRGCRPHTRSLFTQINKTNYIQLKLDLLLICFRKYSHTLFEAILCRVTVSQARKLDKMKESSTTQKESIIWKDIEQNRAFQFENLEKDEAKHGYIVDFGKLSSGSNFKFKFQIRNPRRLPNLSLEPYEVFVDTLKKPEVKEDIVMVVVEESTKNTKKSGFDDVFIPMDDPIRLLPIVGNVDNDMIFRKIKNKYFGVADLWMGSWY